MRSPPSDARSAAEVAARVEADLVRACQICEQIGAQRELSVALGKLAHVALDRDQTDRARSLLAKAVAAARQTGDALRIAHAVRHLGQVHHRQERWQEAEACYREALDVYERADDALPLDHANAVRPMALLLEDRGDPDAAAGMWRKAAGLYRSAGVEAGVEECQARIAQRSG